TTTLRAISGMIHTRGEIVFDGSSLGGRRTEAIARMGIAHVPQGRGTFTDLTVEENLRLGAIGRRGNGIESDLERWYTVFPRLKERRHQEAGSMSGGEQQMLALARAMMSRPRLLLLDEPSLGLAPKLVREIFGIVAELRGSGVTILLVEQNASLALQHADRGYVMEAGRMTLAGPAAELIADDRVRQAYLG
ncbi:MAG TPA: ABC transporter ATP-binding protein, partial [Acidimicrobiia bacterium]|nr:ABC transporter ATP-binding protein [Acidimicrobiia bacterium]